MATNRHNSCFRSNPPGKKTTTTTTTFGDIKDQTSAKIAYFLMPRQIAQQTSIAKFVSDFK
jgi:hypothetical protein